ncbi:MAG: hypothetical protein ACREPP_09970, partial [Rhodanobacteraceae bacterium]
IYNGKSYVFFASSVPPQTNPTRIFLTNIDNADPLVRQLTPDGPLRARTDPEVFFANDGPYIYYNRGTVDPGKRTCLACNEGVYRAYTGIAPAQ